MNPLRFRFYLEVLAISMGIVLIVCIIPIQAFIKGEVRALTVFCGTILWFTIFLYNETFHILIEKWFKR